MTSPLSAPTQASRPLDDRTTTRPSATEGVQRGPGKPPAVLPISVAQRTLPSFVASRQKRYSATPGPPLPKPPLPKPPPPPLPPTSALVPMTKILPPATDGVE